jgi:hypothetical protein
MREIEKMFITGVYGSGKTYFAERYGKRHRLPYKNFDLLHDYTSKKNQSKKILNDLRTSFIIDAIPFDLQSGWADFVEYESQNKVLVVCVYCPDRSVWLRRVHKKLFRRQFPGRRGKVRWYMHSVKGILYKMRYRRERPLPIDTHAHLRAYREFFTNCLPLLEQFKQVKYYDSVRREYTSKKEMLESIRFEYFCLEDHLDDSGTDYDKWYQDIEILHFIGYTESHKTWERIKDLVDWKRKSVNDLGCFHGYFAFKAEEAGAVVWGFDQSSAALTTARMINDLRGGNVIFEEWVAGDALPECDVILCLNSLHHFENQERALSRMRCKQAIFEINEDCLPSVEKYFEVNRRVASHRADRTILLCSPHG